MNKIFRTVLCGVLLAMLPLGGYAANTVSKIEMRSTAFSEGAMMPSDFTCDGADMSPPIEWGSVPSATKSMALIMEDPDAPSGDWTHWLAYDLSPSLKKLPAGILGSGRFPGGGVQGRTDFGEIGYGGPCPPQGSHRYFFKVYALDVMLGLKPGASKQELLGAMQGHILAQGQIMGTTSVPKTPRRDHE
jgi:Raf kinase inhibitor-like YbhB/YbcL family protein